MLSSVLKMEDVTLRYTVCMADTDATGVVHHGRYIDMVERARNKLMNLTGFTFGELARQYQVVPFVHRVNAIYHAPALLDDQLTLKTRLAKCEPSRSVWVTDIRRNHELLATVTVEVVTLHATTRQLVRHPQVFLDRLVPFLEVIPVGCPPPHEPAEAQPARRV